MLSVLLTFNGVHAKVDAVGEFTRSEASPDAEPGWRTPHLGVLTPLNISPTVSKVVRI